jgi:hypothetical protein
MVDSGPGKIISDPEFKDVTFTREETIAEKFLDKLELMTPREREVLIESINWFNNPMFKIKTSQS